MSELLFERLYSRSLSLHHSRTPPAWRYVCWTPEARRPGSACIVELSPILVAREVFCIKLKLLGW